MMIENSVEMELMEIFEQTNISKSLSVSTSFSQMTGYIVITLNKVENDVIYMVANNFKTNMDFPYMSYNIKNMKRINKTHKDFFVNENADLLTKWSNVRVNNMMFKAKLKSSKILTIFMNDFLKMEFKIQWSEDENADASDVNDIFETLIRLVGIFNSNNNNIFNVPDISDFTVNSMGTYSKITLDKKSDKF